MLKNKLKFIKRKNKYIHNKYDYYFNIIADKIIEFNDKHNIYTPNNFKEALMYYRIRKLFYNWFFVDNIPKFDIKKFVNDLKYYKRNLEKIRNRLLKEYGIVGTPYRVGEDDHTTLMYISGKWENEFRIKYLLNLIEYYDKENTK